MKKHLVPSIAIGINLLLLSIFLVKIASASYPWVGLDNRLFLTRLIDTHLHYVINGFSIQWYTPSFGGGLPAYPNPLQMQFSITQLITLVTDPWNAMLISAILYTGLGFIGAYLFLNRLFEFSPFSAVLGALFFTGNGFLVEHLVIGHLNFITFPLIVFPIYALLDNRSSTWASSLTIASVAGVWVYSGGVYIAVICLLSLLTILPVIFFIKPEIILWKRIWKKIIMSGMMVILLTGSKLYAAAALMRNFPRTVHDVYPVHWLEGVGGFIAQLLGTMNVVPLLKLIGKDSLVFMVRLDQWTGTPYGYWELDASLSPALIFLLVLGACTVLFRKPHMQDNHLGKKLAAGAGLIFALVLTVQLSIAKGFLFESISKLPVFASLHANTRFTSAMILPLGILGASVFNRWSGRSSSVLRSGMAYMLLNGVAIIGLWSYFLIPAKVNQPEFEVLSIVETYRRISGGETFPVDKIGSDMSDNEVFLLQASNVSRHYDPLFTDASQFAPRVHDGSVFEIQNGFYNFSDPTGYVFPEVNGSEMYDLIPVNEASKLEDFVNRRQADWKIPTIQIFLNWSAGITLIAMALYPIKILIVKISQIGRKVHPMSRSSSQ